MQHLKIFKVEQLGETLVITPHGDGSAFRYRDLHQEANSIRGVLARQQIQNLIIDLKEMDYFGSEFIGSLVSMLREMRNRRGKACFCSVQPEMLQVLNSMGLFKLWPQFESREAALASFVSEKPADAATQEQPADSPSAQNSARGEENSPS